MEKRVELEMRGRSPDKVTELNLDNCKSNSVVGISADLVNLAKLSLINVGVTTLEGFPALPKLKMLELSDNKLNGELDKLKGSPQLTHLNLSGNKFADLKSLQPLKEFTCLKSLDLYNCDVTKITDYRKEVFGFLPSLKYLDGFDKNDKEEDDNEDDVDDEEVNGHDDDEDSEDEDGLDEDDEDGLEEEDEDEEEIGLGAIYKDNLQDDSDEFEAGEDEEDDALDDEDEEDDDEEDEGAPPKKKTKHEEEEKE